MSGDAINTTSHTLSDEVQEFVKCLASEGGPLVMPSDAHDRWIRRFVSINRSRRVQVATELMAVATRFHDVAGDLYGLAIEHAITIVVAMMAADAALEGALAKQMDTGALKLLGLHSTYSPDSPPPEGAVSLLDLRSGLSTVDEK